MASFNKWIDTLIEEKNIDLETRFEVEGDSGTNSIPLAIVVDCMKKTNEYRQCKIKNILVKIDFMNGDVCHFFKHLAKALAI
jgi:hypothetical protein